jgi:hypothetical protein
MVHHMRKIIKKYPFTTIAATASLVLYGLGLLLNLEIWENLVALIARGEAFELDEFIIPIVLFMIGITLDAVFTKIDAKKMQEKVVLYNQMNEEVMDQISAHLTKLLEFRTALMKDAPNAHDVRHELDRMIVKSFNNYERSQRRSNIDSNLMDLVTSSPNSTPSISTPADAESLNLPSTAHKP